MTRFVLGSGQFVLGAEVVSFEGESACYVGQHQDVGVGSGTAALLFPGLTLAHGTCFVSTPSSSRGETTCGGEAPPVHLQPAYRYIGLLAGSFPVTEAVADRMLSLPIFPELRSEEVERVIVAPAGCVPGAAAGG